MTSHLTCINLNNADSKPAGGFVKGTGIKIDWQNGPLREDGIVREQSGAFVEDVLAAALQRLQYYQRGEFACRENALAITHIEEALHWLQARTAARVKRGVEGTHTP